MILANFFPRNVLSPGGSLLADSQRGPIVFTYVLFGVGRGTGGSKTNKVYCGFFFENVLFDGKLRRDVGRDVGGTFVSFNFFRFKIY